MLTYKLWLEADPDFPEFQRLQYEKAEVPIAQLLLKGIHPAISNSRSNHAPEKINKILNDQAFILAELKELGFSYEFDRSTSDGYYYQADKLEVTLRQIKENVFFVNILSYLELLKIAQKKLLERWDHRTIYTLLGRIYPDFNDLRSFLKKKSKKIKLSGYTDVDKYDLSEFLTLDDFEGEDKILISEALPVTNFRKAAFIRNITDESGHLKLIEAIDRFELRTADNPNDCHCVGIVYNCRRKGITIRLHPILHQPIQVRKAARIMAQKWGQDSGRYCFSINLAGLQQMLETDEWAVKFPLLDYTNQTRSDGSYANFMEDFIPRHMIGSFISANSTGDSIKRILKNHNVSMTGKKDELIAKLAKLAGQVYRSKQKELDCFFTNNKFIKIESNGNCSPRQFPLLEDCDLRNLILTMYAVKHLRGNTILEARHDNNTYDLISLARALINSEISLQGSFISINGI